MALMFRGYPLCPAFIEGGGPAWFPNSFLILKEADYFSQSTPMTRRRVLRLGSLKEGMNKQKGDFCFGWYEKTGKIIASESPSRKGQGCDKNGVKYKQKFGPLYQGFAQGHNETEARRFGL